MGGFTETDIPFHAPAAGAGAKSLPDGFSPPPTPAPRPLTAPRPSPQQRAQTSPPGSLGAGFFALSDGVGRSAVNRRQDVIKVESLLDEADVKKTDGPTGYFGMALEDRIKTYQTHRGLKPDGVIDPDGPTIRTLEDHLAPRIARRPVPTPAQVEAHHQALADGRDSPHPELGGTRRQAPLRLRPPARPLAADDASFAGNRRLVDHLARTREDGLLPRLFADALTTRGDRAEAEFRDFMDQLGRRDPARAASLGRKIRDELPQDHRNRLFHTGDTSGRQPLSCRVGECGPNIGRQPALHRPGWVFDNGRWRPETPEEARRPKEMTMEGTPGAGTGTGGGTGGGGADDAPGKDGGAKGPGDGPGGAVSEDDGGKEAGDGETDIGAHRIGPGNVGQPDEKPETLDPIEAGLRRQGLYPGEIKEEIGRREALRDRVLGTDPTPEDRRAAKLVMAGFDEKQARDLAKLGDKEVDDLYDLALSAPGRQSPVDPRIERLFRRVASQLPWKNDVGRGAGGIR